MFMYVCLFQCFSLGTQYGVDRIDINHDIVGDGIFIPTGKTAANTFISTGAVVHLTAGDTIKIQTVANNNSGASTTTDGFLFPYLTMVQLNKGLDTAGMLYLLTPTVTQTFKTFAEIGMSVSIDWTGATEVIPTVGITTVDQKVFQVSVDGIYLISAQVGYTAAPVDSAGVFKIAIKTSNKITLHGERVVIYSVNKYQSLYGLLPFAAGDTFSNLLLDLR
jgi:hypothetical protein